MYKTVLDPITKQNFLLPFLYYSFESNSWSSWLTEGLKDLETLKRWSPQSNKHSEELSYLSNLDIWRRFFVLTGSGTKRRTNTEDVESTINEELGSQSI